MSSFVNLLEIIYPIGSCYFSTDSTSPSEIIGGTWEQMTGGVLGLVGSTGVASAGKNGGSTKISIDQLPSHDPLNDGKKPLPNNNNQSWEYMVHVTSLGDDPQCTKGRYTYTQTTGRDVTRLVSAGDDSIKVGGGQDYIPAHTAVYGWKRIA